jgi:hypothetical protein
MQFELERLLGVRRPGAAVTELPRSAREQSGARPPHSKETQTAKVLNS